MEQNLMDLIISDKADGWDCFDSAAHLQNSFSFDWEAVFASHQTTPCAAKNLTFGANTICISAPERYSREAAVLGGQGATASLPLQCTGERPRILLGGKEVFQLIDDQTVAVVIDLCGAADEKELADEISGQPESVLIRCVAAAERLNSCSALLLTDDSLWGRTLAMMVYAAAKDAGAPTEVAILQPRAVTSEETAIRRCDIITNWLWRHFK